MITTLTNFIPIHELEDVLNGDSGSQYKENTIKDQDLFLISQLSVPTSPNSDSVILSKKAQFGTIKYEISSDLDIQDMKDDITTLSIDLSSLSSEVTDICVSLSTTIERDYVKKYDTYISADQGKYWKEIVISDGVLLSDQCETDWISSNIGLEGMKLTGGCINGEMIQQSKLGIINSNTKELTCHIESDCYLVIRAHILEGDDIWDPLEVYLKNTTDDGFDSQPIKIMQFNNPGGFSGTNYYNYYQCGLPIKCLTYKTENLSVSHTDIIIKYQNDENFKYSTDERYNDSYIEVIQYRLFGTITNTDLATIVMKDPNTRQSGLLDLYKIRTNEDGLVTKTEPIDFSTDIRDPFPEATLTSYGKVKLLSPENGISTDNNYRIGLTPALSDKLGGVMIGWNNNKPILTNLSSALYPITLSSGQMYVEIPQTDSDVFGVAKVKEPDTASKEYVMIDSDGYLVIQNQTEPFYTTRKTTLVNDDKILVGHTDSNLSNYITYQDLITQIRNDIMNSMNGEQR